MTETSAASTSAEGKGKKLGCGLIMLLFWIVLIGGGVLWYGRSNHWIDAIRTRLSTPKNEVAVTVAAVGKLIQLPNEDVTLATVTDKKKLVSQPFFSRAENGDRVLIYAKSMKAILYRPSINKIIEVGPISLGSASSSSASVTPVPVSSSPSATLAPRKP